MTLKKGAPGPPIPRRSGRVLDGSRHWFGMLLLAVSGFGVPVASSRAQHRDRRGTVDHHDQRDQERLPRYVARCHHRWRRTGGASVSRGPHPAGGDPGGVGHRDHPPESRRPDGRTVRRTQPRARHVGRGHPGAGPVAGRSATGSPAPRWARSSGRHPKRQRLEAGDPSSAEIARKVGRKVCAQLVLSIPLISDGLRLHSIARLPKVAARPATSSDTVTLARNRAVVDQAGDRCTSGRGRRSWRRA